MGVIFTTTCKKKIYVTKSLQPDEWDIASTTLELIGTIHFEMMYARRRIIGSLQSQDLDGKPTFGFIVMGWSVNELICLEAPKGGFVMIDLLSRAVRLKAPKGGFVLIVVENDRVL
jgi:hypothetical protein